jgi:hypothetical protein
MKAADVQEIVQAAGVDPTSYSLEGDRHEALCLMAWGQEWRVFVSERGQRFDEQAFATEDEACVEFLKRLFRFGGPR